MLNSKRERRRYVEEHPISASMAQKLPMLIRNDGLYPVLAYLEEKDKAAFAHIYSYILMIRPEDNKKLDLLGYMNLQRECYYLAEEYKLSSLQEGEKAGEVTEKDLFKKMEKMYKEAAEQYIKSTDEQSPGNMVHYDFKGEIWDKYCGEIIKKSGPDITGLLSNIPAGFSICEIGNIRTKGKMIVGLGESSVNEVSIKMNTIYNNPYIPGSSVKGVFHHYCEELAGSGKFKGDLIKWFGTEEEEGKIIFTDSYFTKYKIVKDCITPHYGNYYTNGEWPKDTEEPKSFPFFCIADAELNLVLLYDAKSVQGETLQKDLLNCLKTCSFGAKKSSGYGYLEVSQHGK